jgi:hypothetical protein
MTWPVMYVDALLARKTYAPAHSHGSPARPSGTSLPKLFTFSGGKVAGMSGVQIGHGATAFTRMFFFASMPLSDRVNVTIAPFVAL